MAVTTFSVCSSSPHPASPTSPCGPASCRLDLRRGRCQRPSRSELERWGGGSGREAPAAGEGRRSDYEEVLPDSQLPPRHTTPLHSLSVTFRASMHGRAAARSRPLMFPWCQRQEGDVLLHYSSYWAEVRFQIHDIEIGVKGPVARSPLLPFSFIPCQPLELDHKGGVLEVFHHEMRPSSIAFHHCDWWL